VHEGDRIGLIGRNGSGKSTLLKILIGEEVPDGGQVTRKQGLRVDILHQSSRLDPALTVDQALLGAASDVRALLAEYESKTTALARAEGPEARAELGHELEALQHELEITDAWSLDQELKRVSVALSLPDGSRTLGSLSGGELRRVDIACAVIRHPDVLLLDEPTNHIDVQSVEWIESFLAGYAGSCVVVTHDRYFLERVATRIAELEFGTLTAYSGNYERYLELKATRLEIEARQEANRQRFLRRELEWVKRGPKARGTKEKARIARYEARAEEGGPEQHRDIEFLIPEPPRLGKRILEADGIAKSYDGRVLFHDFNLIMQKHMRVGIVGPNGTGKSTLLRVLMGREKPDTGWIQLGESTRFIYVDQGHEEVSPETPVLDFVSDGQREIEVNGRRVFVPGFLEKFLFDQSVTRMQMGYLSGGERNRLDLCRKLLHGGNFLVFDEPTNDLDLPALRVLEEAIDEFKGCALIVSHDRYFLNRLCTHVIVFEGEGEVVTITGNYDDYLLYRDRKRKERPEKVPENKVPAPSRNASGNKVRRLTYNEKRELADMDAAILEAEQAVEALEATLHAPGFYEQDYAVVEDTLERHRAAKARVEQLYERWQELETIANG